MPLRLAILASGNGSNAQAMISAMQAGTLHIEIPLIASNNPKAYVLTRAEKAGIPTYAFDHRDFKDRESCDRAIVARIREANCDAVALAGYMRLLSHTFLTEFGGPVLNLHPALLPSFPGLHGARDALAYGVTITGATVHFVDEKMDNGPIIIQAAIPIRPNESEDELLSRIHALEHRIYPQAIEWLAQGRLVRKGRIVTLTGKGKPGIQPESALISPELEEGM
ncbi:MAG: phosphoribosylglycinamide formyltransferase [Desulfovibrionaceae bacterium]|nr:phosphoribosylglycinamide formyltransferase [Desulfovibrionaceae bacterium]